MTRESRVPSCLVTYQVACVANTRESPLCQVGGRRTFKTLVALSRSRSRVRWADRPVTPYFESLPAAARRPRPPAPRPHLLSVNVCVSVPAVCHQRLRQTQKRKNGFRQTKRRVL